MHRQILRIALLAVTVFSSFYIIFAEDSAKKHPRVQPPKLTLLAATKVTIGGQQFYSLAFEVLNPNNASLVYTGYTPDSFGPPLKKGIIAPLFHIELKRDGKLQPHPMGFCGTGLADVELAPESSSTFTVHVPATEWQSVKIGIGHNQGWSREGSTTTTIWSTEILRKEVEKLP